MFQKSNANINNSQLNTNRRFFLNIAQQSVIHTLHQYRVVKQFVDSRESVEIAILQLEFRLETTRTDLSRQ